MTCGVVWVVIASFVFALAGTGVMRRYALRRNLLDLPNCRSSHSTPTPRGGGVAIVAAFFMALVAMSLVTRIDAKVFTALVAGGGLIAVIGFLDDRGSLSASVRFAVHLLAAIVAVGIIGGIPEVSLSHWGLHGVWVGSTLAVLAVVWATNLFNFMDGIDGVAGGEAVFMAVAGAWLNWTPGGDPALTLVTLCLAAGSLGFLVWNWPPAQIFMGDAGSGFLGFTLAVLGLATSRRSEVPVEVWAILGGVFLVDATVTLLRRALRGERWFEAHRTHAYQYLARRWNGHLPVTTVVLAIDLVWLLPWAWLAKSAPSQAPLCMAAALLPLGILAFTSGAGRREE